MYKESDTEDNVVTFESGDLLSPNSWSNVDVLESGESHKSIFHKLSTMVKNIRYLYDLINNLSTKYDREHPTGYASLDASGHVFICNEPNKVFDPSQSTGNTAVAASTWYVTEKYNSLGKSVADGKKAVADAISAQGYTTATDATFATLTEQVGVMGNGRYNSGYAQGVTDADGRVNTSSANYQAGYDAGEVVGVNSGYELGYGEGYQKGNSDGYTLGSTEADQASENSIKNGENKFKYRLSAAYMKSDNDGNYLGLEISDFDKYYYGDKSFPVVEKTDGAFIDYCANKEFSVGGGYRCWVVLYVWKGTRYMNGWTNVGSWNL